MNDVIYPIVKSDKLYHDYFKEISKLESDDIIYRPNCKFCSHPARAEAEDKWEQTGIYSNVLRFFEKYNKDHPDGPLMNFVNIKNHLMNHYAQQQKNIWLREYGERLLSVMNKRVSDEQRFDLMKQQFELKLHEISSDPTLDPFKQVDAMTKLGKIILDIAETGAKLRGELQSVHLVTEKLTNVWVSTIQQQDDPKIKKILLDSLDEFQEQFIPLLNSDAESKQQ